MSNTQRTLLQIRQENGLALEAIAFLARVAVEDVYYMEAGCFYSQEMIDNVLQAVSLLTGKYYTLATVGGVHVKK